MRLQFRKLGYQIIDSIVDYRENLEKLPVRSEVKPGYLSPLLPAHAPERGQSLEQIMQDFHQHIIPGVTHWQHPSFFS